MLRGHIKLTPEEITAAKSSTFFERHSWGLQDYGLNPCAKVAESRGVEFEFDRDLEDKRYRIVNFEEDIDFTMRTSLEVARWLGFTSLDTFYRVLEIEQKQIFSRATY